VEWLQRCQGGASQSGSLEVSLASFQGDLRARLHLCATIRESGIVFGDVKEEPFQKEYTEVGGADPGIRFKTRERLMSRSIILAR